MKIKPKVQIGEKVNIVNVDVVQTSYGLNVINLWSKINDRFLDYYVHDIKVEIKLKNGEIKYHYLISRDKRVDNKRFYGGWVSDKSIKPSEINNKIA